MHSYKCPVWIMYPNVRISKSAHVPSRGGCLCGLKGNISITVLTESHFLQFSLAFILCVRTSLFIYFFHFSLSVRKSPSVFSYIWTHSWLDIDCFIGKRQRGENPLITFKLFSFIASCWKRADGGIKKEKVDYACVSSSCNDPPHTHTSPPCAGARVHRTAAATREGTDTSLITPAIRAKRHKAPPPIKQLLGLVLLSLPILHQLANQPADRAERQMGCK